MGPCRATRRPTPPRVGRQDGGAVARRRRAPTGGSVAAFGSVASWGHRRCPHPTVPAGLVTVGRRAVLREAWQGTVSPRTVIGLAVTYHVAVLFLPLLFSRDVYSYAFYGRIAAVYHANPYVATPSNFPSDPLAQYVGPRWVGTPAVYGPLFTLLSSGVARLFGSVGASIAAFRFIAIAASLATIAVLAPLVRMVRPDREAFAVAMIGLNPVVLFQSVASGHNDLLVALAIAGALALVFAGKELPATAALSLGAMV